MVIQCHDLDLHFVLHRGPHGLPSVRIEKSNHPGVLSVDDADCVLCHCESGVVEEFRPQSGHTDSAQQTALVGVHRDRCGVHQGEEGGGLCNQSGRLLQVFCVTGGPVGTVVDVQLRACGCHKSSKTEREVHNPIPKVKSFACLPVQIPDNDRPRVFQCRVQVLPEHRALRDKPEHHRPVPPTRSETGAVGTPCYLSDGSRLRSFPSVCPPSAIA
mmetsp:Transcript_47197/g.93096  ORF Transcript_47197/g.93096 Transcript_47197/m.93096 type:complete len:215 (-) Transcript_47197:467-1111(-)